MLTHKKAGKENGEMLQNEGKNFLKSAAQFFEEVQAELQKDLGSSSATKLPKKK